MMDQNLHRYWVRLASSERRKSEFGGTAFIEQDALAILADVVFPARRCREPSMCGTTSTRDLDQGHVVPHMNPPNWRGVWYPKGFDTDIH